MPDMKIGVAFSGGAAKGLAHIGVLKALEREGLAIDCLAGTSMGGVIGGGYAAGMTPDDMEAEAIRMSKTRRLVDLVDRGIPRQGLLEGTRVRQYLINQIGEETTFADLRLPFAVVSVDLLTGLEVVLSQGRVVEAVRATTAIPGILAPVAIGEYRLVDGGVLNNLPADVVRGMGAQVVIAVDVGATRENSVIQQGSGGRWFIPDGLVHIASDTQRSLSILMMSHHEQRLRAAQPDVIIRPLFESKNSSLTGFMRPQEIIAAGERATIEALPQIKESLARPALQI